MTVVAIHFWIAFVLVFVAALCRRPPTQRAPARRRALLQSIEELFNVDARMPHAEVPP